MKWIPLYVALLVVGTLSPFTFRCVPADWSFDPEALDLLANLLLFLPLGWCLRRHPLAATALAACVSLGIEWAQTWILRTASPWDIAMNTMGAGLGALIAPVLARRGIEVPLPRHLAPALSVLLVGLLAGAGLLAYQVPSNTLAEWDRGHSLALGAEPDGSRQWRGTIGGFEIHDRAQGGSLVLGGTFVPHPGEDGSTGAPDGSCALRINGQLEERAFGLKSGPDGLELTGTPLILPEEAAQAVYTACSRSGELMVRATFRTDPHHPESQGRILTLSSGPERRCLTVGWRDAHLVFRVRTRGTGPNGTSPQIITSQPVLDGSGWYSVRATFDGAWSRTHVGDGFWWDPRFEDRCVGEVLMPLSQSPTLVGNAISLTACLVALAATLLLRCLRAKRLAATLGGVAACGILIVMGAVTWLPGWPLRVALPAVVIAIVAGFGPALSNRN